MEKISLVKRRKKTDGTEAKKIIAQQTYVGKIDVSIDDNEGEDLASQEITESEEEVVSLELTPASPDPEQPDTAPPTPEQPDASLPATTPPTPEQPDVSLPATEQPDAIPTIMQPGPIRSDLRQSDLIRSKNYIKELLQVVDDGVNADIQQDEEGKIIFNFHFKPIYTIEMLSSKQVCEMLQVSRKYIAKLVKTEQLKSYKLGRRRRFTLEDILDYINKNRES